MHNKEIKGLSMMRSLKAGKVSILYGAHSRFSTQYC